MKKLIALLLSLAMVLSLAACGAKEEPAATQAPAAAPAATEAAPVETEAPAPTMEPVTLNVATSYAEGSDYINAMQAACDAITEQTNGAVNFTIYCSNQLGSGADCTEMMLNGATVMAGIGMANLAGYVKEAAIPSYPFVVNDYEELVNLTTSDWWAGVKQQLIEQHDMVPIMYLSVGYRNMIGTVPVKTAADLAPVITRIGLGTIGQQFIEACGGTPTTTSAFTECYSAIQTKMFELCEADVELLFNNALYEVSPYLSMTHHMTCPSIFAVHSSVWESILPEYQEIIIAEFEKAAENIWNNYSSKEDEWLTKFEEKGITVIRTEEVDIESFRPTVSFIMEKQGVDASVYETVLAAAQGK